METDETVIRGWLRSQGWHVADLGDFMDGDGDEIESPSLACAMPDGTAMLVGAVAMRDGHVRIPLQRWRDWKWAATMLLGALFVMSVDFADGKVLRIDSEAVDDLPRPDPDFVIILRSDMQIVGEMSPFELALARPR